jgi:hypothetical protein
MIGNKIYGHAHDSEYSILAFQDVVKMMKGLQEQIQLIEWDDSET